jgi:hypothetical protein
MRLIDITIRDHCALLYVICGNTHIRAHKGTAFYYNNNLGSWDQYRGRLQNLNGIKRLFARDVDELEVIHS